MAKASPFRFSTKYQDDETDLLYYGYRYYDASTGRWLCLDPCSELGLERVMDPATKRLLHSAVGRRDSQMFGYAFVRNAPVTSTDLVGLKLILPQEGQGTMDFQQALTYLAKSSTAGKIIEQLQKSTEDYKVVFDYAPGPLNLPPGLWADPSPGGYAPSSRTIYWQPRMAMSWKNWNCFMAPTHHLTPALMLLHEMGHAYHQDTSPDEFKKFADEVTHDKWSDLEEKHNIEQIENVVAKELGPPESKRDFHTVIYGGVYNYRIYGTTGPTSIQEVDKASRPPGTFSPLKQQSMVEK